MNNEKLAKRSTLLMASYYVLLYAASAMNTTYLTAFGYSETQVSMLLTAAGLIGLCSRPLFTVAIDRGRCRLLCFLLLASVAAGECALFFAPRKTVAAAMIQSVLTTGVGAGLLDLLDSWVMKLIKQGAFIDYGRVRSGGSLSFAVAGVPIGAAVTRFGTGFAPYLILLLTGIIAAVAAGMPDPQAEEKGREKGDLVRYGDLLRDRRFLLFLLLSSVTACAFNQCGAYYPVVILSRGGTPLHAGLFSFFSATIEFFALRRFTVWADRMGTDRALATGMAGTAVKCLAVALVPTPGWLLCCSVTQLFSMCFFTPGKMRFISEEADEADLASALTLTGIFSQAVSAFVSGPIATRLIAAGGIPRMLTLYGLASAVAAVLFLLLAGKKETAPRE